MESILFSDDTEKKKAIGLIHRLYITQLKNAYKHTASTKTKSEVRGGGRKPRPQKGQGYARSGSIRSPLWVGGGVIFGPKPHLVSKKINKKEKRLAILSALYLKKNQWSLINENLFNDFKTYKTKEIVKMLSSLKIKSTERILIVLTKSNPQFWESASNLKNVVITTASCLNVKELLHANHIILSQDSLNIINSNYKKNYE
jgi:large subunit ribosomal protein L4